MKIIELGPVFVQSQRADPLLHTRSVVWGAFDLAKSESGFEIMVLSHRHAFNFLYISFIYPGVTEVRRYKRRVYK